MKILSFTLIGTLVALSLFSAAVATSDPTSDPGSGRDFLVQWAAFLESDAYKDFGNLSLEYLYETRNWRGIRKTEKRILRFGKGAANPFSTLFAMTKPEVLRDVEAHTEHKNVYTMTLPEALTLKEPFQEETQLPATATCQLFEREESPGLMLPRRFIFLADTPRGWKTRQVRIVYTWNYRTYQYDEEEEERFWIPEEVLIESLARKRRATVVISERWTLLRIRAVRTATSGEPREIPPED
jgi:hypothetical protein